MHAFTASYTVVLSLLPSPIEYLKSWPKQICFNGEEREEETHPRIPAAQLFENIPEKH